MRIQKGRESPTCTEPLFHVLQLRQDSSNAQGARAMAEGGSVPVWSLGEIAELLSKFYFFFRLLVRNVLLGIFL
jgi:hypothetical protein